MQAHKVPDGQIRSESTRIYVIRPSTLGVVVKPNIYENNNIVGRIGSKAYLGWDTKPGDITLQGGNGFIKIEAKPGKIYYLKLQPNFTGIQSNGFSFTPISEEEGKKYISKLNTPKVKVAG
jgi:hypothetical protein